MILVERLLGKSDGISLSGGVFRTVLDIASLAPWRTRGQGLAPLGRRRASTDDLLAGLARVDGFNRVVRRPTHRFPLAPASRQGWLINK